MTRRARRANFTNGFSAPDFENTILHSHLLRPAVAVGWGRSVRPFPSGPIVLPSRKVLIASQVNEDIDVPTLARFRGLRARTHQMQSAHHFHSLEPNAGMEPTYLPKGRRAITSNFLTSVINHCAAIMCGYSGLKVWHVARSLGWTPLRPRARLGRCRQAPPLKEFGSQPQTSLPRRCPRTIDPSSSSARLLVGCAPGLMICGTELRRLTFGTWSRRFELCHSIGFTTEGPVIRPGHGPRPRARPQMASPATAPSHRRPGSLRRANQFHVFRLGQPLRRVLQHRHLSDGRLLSGTTRRRSRRPTSRSHNPAGPSHPWQPDRADVGLVVAVRVLATLAGPHASLSNACTDLRDRPRVHQRLPSAHSPSESSQKLGPPRLQQGQWNFSSSSSARRLYHRRPHEYAAHTAMIVINKSYHFLFFVFS